MSIPRYEIQVVASIPHPEDGEHGVDANEVNELLSNIEDEFGALGAEVTAVLSRTTKKTAQNERPSRGPLSLAGGGSYL